jgi:hypothetical protein
MFIAYQEKDLKVYIPISAIGSVEYSHDDEDLCIWLKECPAHLKLGRTEKERHDCLSVIIPPKEHNFVLAQLHRLGGFTKDQIKKLSQND